MERIGNDRINKQNVESRKPHVAGFIMEELTPVEKSKTPDPTPDPFDFTDSFDFSRNHLPAFGAAIMSAAEVVAATGAQSSFDTPVLAEVPQQRPARQHQQNQQARHQPCMRNYNLQAVTGFV